MKKKIFSILFALVLAVSLTLVPAAVSANPGTVVKVDPASQVVIQGTSFEVDIYVEDVVYMAGGQATVNFDASAMQAIGITEGDFLKSGGSTLGIELIDNAAGTVTVAYVLMWPWVGVDSSGVLATIEFEADASASGTFDLTLTDVLLIDGGVEGDWTGGSEISCTSEDGTVTIAVEVDIDIKPGSDPNSINPNSKGVIPVAILTTPSFDATTVDGTTVTFGPNAATPAYDLTDPLVVAEHQQDVDGDGDTDYVFHFRTQATGIAKGHTSATLTGLTTGGIPITGTDSIRTVGK